jgi:hypothetical protein
VPTPEAGQVPEIDKNVRHPRNKNAARARFSLFQGRPNVRENPGTRETIFFRPKREQSSKGRGMHKREGAGKNDAKADGE